MNPIAAQLMITLAPVALRAAGPLMNKAGHTIIDVYAQNGRAMANLINAVAERVRHGKTMDGNRPPPVKTGPNTVIILPPPGKENGPA